MEEPLSTPPTQKSPDETPEPQKKPYLIYGLSALIVVILVGIAAFTYNKQTSLNTVANTSTTSPTPTNTPATTSTPSSADTPTPAATSTASPAPVSALNVTQSLNAIDSDLSGADASTGNANNVPSDSDTAP